MLCLGMHTAQYCDAPLYGADVPGSTVMKQHRAKDGQSVHETGGQTVRTTWIRWYGEKKMVKQYMGLEITPEQRTPPPPCTLRRRALYFHLPQRGKDVGNLSAARQKLGFKNFVLNET
jgi:hypothetical protein